MDQEEKIEKKEHKKKRSFFKSLRTQIGIMYFILAGTNITFFNVMIFENQNDLLLNNFQLLSKELVRTILEDLSGKSIEKSAAGYENLQSSLEKSTGIHEFILFEKEGEILYRHPEAHMADRKIVPDAIKRKVIEMATQSTLFRSRYNLEMNEQDFSVDFILPVQTDRGEVYFQTTLGISAVQERLNKLYEQILIVIGWGTFFHILFGIFLYRVIFRRVGILTQTSNEMAEGDLSSRADWKMKREDELDELGESFNSMAEKIEQNVTTITRLNTQIQQELEIGKEVQELFLPKKKVLDADHMSIYYRPLREVSGDIYKFYKYNNGSRGVFFADASGHGVSAALITTITIMSLDLVVRKSSQPGTILSMLNETLNERLEGTFFCTGTFFTMTPTGTVTISNAGHNPPLYIPAGGAEIVEIPKNGPPMGMMDGVEYDQVDFHVKPKDRFFIYSDGLVESKDSEDNQFTLERVKDLLMENYTRPLSETVDLLAKLLEEHTEEYMDDVSIIYLEMPG